MYAEDSVTIPLALQALERIENGMDLRQDPYIKELMQNQDANSQSRIAKVLLGKKTFCSEQISSFCRISTYIYQELGVWATEWYIWNSLQNYYKMVDDEEDLISEWTMAEKSYLVSLLQEVQLCVQNPYEATEIKVSPKAQRLIDLLAHASSSDFVGLIFVKQRATVAALAELLSTHPDVKDLYKLGTYIGTSVSGKRKHKSVEKVDLREQQQSLEDFKSGKKNLILGTSVLEEGIDVAACNNVWCFETPENLKSYIQRRGRARMQGSRYVIFLSEGNFHHEPQKWGILEDEMRQAYMDELREVQVMSELEESEEHDGRNFRVLETGALLTLDNAVTHLHHFCAKVTADRFVDPRPQFTKIEDHYGGEHQSTSVRMKVILPPTLKQELRTATSTKSWASEKNAKRDAAFEAYLNLYRAGLVNDNLLPLEIMNPDELTMDWTDGGPAIVSASDLTNPWKLAMSKQEKTKDWCAYMAVVSYPVHDPAKTLLFLPADVGEIPDIPLYWREGVRYMARLKRIRDMKISAADLDIAQGFTKILLSSVFGTRMRNTKDDYVALFVPFETCGQPLSQKLLSLAGEVPAATVQSIGSDQTGLIREKASPGRALLFHDFEMMVNSPSSERLEGESKNTGLMIRCTKIPKRRDFLHPVQQREHPNETLLAFPASECTMDNLPSKYSIFALFIPSIIHRCGLNLIAKDLNENLLSPLKIKSLDLIRAAITASSARDEVDYQRLEFLGDGLLKYYISVQVFYDRPNYPEKFLTAEKTRRVANATLANAALEKGLDKYIIRNAFTGFKWLPIRIEQVLEQETKQVALARKTLADVVEALIGASYVDGGWPKAVACIEIFSPRTAPSTDEPDTTSNPSTAPCGKTTRKLEDLIGYTFTTKALLLEAMTHASYTADAHTRCYDRLEFLGDAILDHIVTPRLFQHRPSAPLKHDRMHGIRTAVVNADFLAFCCMTYCAREPRVRLEPDEREPHGFVQRNDAVDRHLWQFLRKSNWDVTRAQQASLGRNRGLRAEIEQALEQGAEYPWAQLLQISAEKFFSDIVESVIGAIYLDSGRDLRACERFVERIGVLRVLDRILRDDVKVVHPKERLGVLAGNEKVTYAVKTNGHTTHCVLKIGLREVASGEGRTAEIARTYAARNAVHILEK